MSFLDLNLDDAQEPTTVPSGEYKLRIENAEIKTSQKTGGQFLSLRLSIPDQVDAQDFNHVLMMPTANDDAKTANKRKWAIKQCMEAFEIPYSPNMNVEEMKGYEGWGNLVEEDDPQYGKQNRVRSFITKK